MTNEKKDYEDIKRLLMLLLIKLGATSEEIGYALKLESSVIRKMLPSSKIKKLKESNKTSRNKSAEENDTE
ncbi:hypothetical protein [Nitrosopumilus sp.]|uniref:hypothetical protein n=1 Tax=Nitrosopumilus sp. TaxID=2024843 RepID=UPI003D0CD8D5